jgi:hypothetical protein
MPLLFGSELPWAFLGTIQILGLIVAVATRLAEGSCRQIWCQVLFFASMVLVGLVTIAALRLGPGCWMVSGTTFSVMVLTVTCDFRTGEDVAEG